MKDLDLSNYAIRDNNARQEINDMRCFADAGDISKTINAKLGSKFSRSRKESLRLNVVF